MKHFERAVPVAAILFVAMPSVLAAQEPTVRGRVVRADMPVALADVELELRPSGATTRSDSRGVFTFDGVAAGEAEVLARRPGFVTATVALRVAPVGVTHVEVRLEPVFAFLDPIVTSATRLDDRTLVGAAVPVTVLDTGEVDRGRTVSLDETLRFVRGVQVASRYGTDDVSISIRGSTARWGNGVRGVAVLLDGVPLTEPDGVARLDLLDLAAARQVELVRGPASARYAGSAGGVVNVVSRTGRDSPGVTARTQVGAFGLRKHDGRVGGVFSDGRGSGIFAASYTTTDGHRAHSETEVVRGQLSLEHLLGTGTRWSLQAAGSRLDSRHPGSLAQAEFDADPTAASAPATVFGFGRRDRRFRAGVRLEQALGGDVAEGYFFYGGRTLDFPLPGQTVDLNLKRVQAGGHVRFLSPVDLPLDATVGLEYDDVFGADRRWSNLPGSEGAHGSPLDDGRFSVPGFGAYGRLGWHASETVTATAGLRIDRVEYRFESEFPGALPEKERTFEQLSPQLSASWRPDPGTLLYASAGRGLEVPTIGELSPGPGRPFSPVRPRSLWSYELGGRRIVSDRLLLEGAAYVAAVRGEFVPVTVDGRPAPENASRSRNVGGEIGLTVRPSADMEVGASYSYVDVRLTDYSTRVLDGTGASREVDYDGKRLPGVPAHRLTGDVRMRPADRLTVGAQAEWQSVVYVETGNAERGIWYVQADPGGPVLPVPFRAVPARLLVHLDAALRLGPATLFGRVENLFDERYAADIVANERSGRFYLPGPPASVSLGLSLTGRGTAGDRPAPSPRTRPVSSLADVPR